MLRSLTKGLQIYLHPNRIVVAFEEGLFNRRVVSKQIIHITQAAEEIKFQSVLLSLRNLLEKPEWTGVGVEIVLSGHFVKYRIADWNAQLNFDEQVMRAKHHYEEIYGAVAKSWDIFISNSGFRKSELVCAVDTGLLSSINGLFESNPARLISIKPFLTVAINALRKKINKVAYVGVVENSHIHFARFSSNGWESVRTRIVEEVETQLSILFEREVLYATDYNNEDPIYFLQSELNSYKLSLTDDKNIHTINMSGFLGLLAGKDFELTTEVCA